MCRHALTAAMATSLFWSLGGASPARSQLEPEVFTILKTAATKIPPDPSEILYAVKSRKTVEDRQKIADVWVQVWKHDAIVFDALGACLAGGNTTKEAAPKLIKRLHPTVSDKEIQQASFDFLAPLDALSDAERQCLGEFAKLAKDRIRPRTVR